MRVMILVLLFSFSFMGCSASDMKVSPCDKYRERIDEKKGVQVDAVGRGFVPGVAKGMNIFRKCKG